MADAATPLKDGQVLAVKHDGEEKPRGYCTGFPYHALIALCLAIASAAAVVFGLLEMSDDDVEHVLGPVPSLVVFVYMGLVVVIAMYVVLLGLQKSAAGHEAHDMCCCRVLECLFCGTPSTYFLVWKVIVVELALFAASDPFKDPKVSDPYILGLFFSILTSVGVLVALTTYTGGKGGCCGFGGFPCHGLIGLCMTVGSSLLVCTGMAMLGDEMPGPSYAKSNYASIVFQVVAITVAAFVFMIGWQKLDPGHAVHSMYCCKVLTCCFGTCICDWFTHLLVWALIGSEVLLFGVAASEWREIVRSFERLFNSANHPFYWGLCVFTVGMFLSIISSVVVMMALTKYTDDRCCTGNFDDEKDKDNQATDHKPLVAYA